MHSRNPTLLPTHGVRNALIVGDPATGRARKLLLPLLQETIGRHSRRPTVMLVDPEKRFAGDISKPQPAALTYSEARGEAAVSRCMSFVEQHAGTPIVLAIEQAHGAIGAPIIDLAENGEGVQLIFSFPSIADVQDALQGESERFLAAMTNWYFLPMAPDKVEKQRDVLYARAGSHWKIIKAAVGHRCANGSAFKNRTCHLPDVVAFHKTPGGAMEQQAIFKSEGWFQSLEDLA